MNYASSGMRRCISCGGIFPSSAEYFYRNKSNHAGLTRLCKPCNKIKDKNRPKKKYVLTDYQKEIYRKKRKAREKECRILCLKYYSNSDVPYCRCCGEKTIEFLTLDHINGGGRKHRKEIGSNNYYRWLVKNKPEIIQILCYNCNCSKGHFGHCPHEKKVRY